MFILAAENDENFSSLIKKNYLEGRRSMFSKTSILTQKMLKPLLSLKYDSDSILVGKNSELKEENGNDYWVKNVFYFSDLPKNDLKDKTNK